MLKKDRIEKEFRERYPDRIVTIDSHIAGEPARLIVGGLGPLPGENMQNKREYFMEHYDHIRLLLTREPRGQRSMSAKRPGRPPVTAGRWLAAGECCAIRTGLE